jgi:hypothetical protein
MDHSEFYRLFNHYWWLIFPVGWGLAGLVRAYFRHQRAQQAMEVLKSYVDQGKEPPQELVTLFKASDRRSHTPQQTSRGLLLASLIFAALSVAFYVLRMARGVGIDADNDAGLLFVTTLMAGFAVAFFIGSLVTGRDARKQIDVRQDRP